jgi:hypothetical protein
MFVGGFEKVAFIGKLLSKIKPGNALSAAAKSTPTVNKPLAYRRIDKKPVTTDWGLKQGLKSDNVRYADIL